MQDDKKNSSSSTDQQYPLSSQEGVGLENLGNTCYMNAVLQCLAAAPGLQKFLSQRDVLQPCEQPSIEDAFTELMQALQTAVSGQVISPSR